MMSVVHSVLPRQKKALSFCSKSYEQNQTGQ